MHILFVVENSSVPQDVRVWSEALAVQEFGHDVSIICPKFKTTDLGFEELNGIRVYRHWRPFEADGKLGFLIEYGNALLWELILSFLLYARKPFQVIHSANPPDHIFLLAGIFKLLGVKFIFDHHDLCPENYVVKFNRKDLLYEVLLLMEKLSFKTADIVISTNESYKRVAVERGKKKEGEVFVVRNGPDLSKISIPQPNGKLKEGFDFLVAYAGVIGVQERIEVLIKAVHHIVHEKGIRNIKFVIVGRGPCRAKMIELSRRLNLEAYVCFTGYVPYRDFNEILASADLCVNPEYKNDFTDKSTMIKIMDYMMFGRPIVQFETTEGRVTAGNSAAYVKDNDVIDFAETIVDLLHNPQRRRKMGRIGQDRIFSHLNWEMQKTSLRKAYELVNGRPQRSSINNKQRLDRARSTKTVGKTGRDRVGSSWNPFYKS